jgi:hypothetical protein
MLSISDIKLKSITAIDIWISIIKEQNTLKINAISEMICAHSTINNWMKFYMMFTEKKAVHSIKRLLTKAVVLK